MIEIARQLDVIFRRRTYVTLDDSFSFATAMYHMITAIEVIALKHASPQTIDQLRDKLGSGGMLIFSSNNHTLENTEYLQASHDSVTHVDADILEEDNGPQIVMLSMTSKIIVLLKS